MRPNLYLKVFAPGIGDLVVILPILKNLKENYMEKVNVLVFNEAQASLLTRFPYVDDILLIEEGKDYREIIKYRGPGNFYIDIAETEMESKYWWGSEEFIKDLGEMHIYDVMKECIKIGGDYKNIEPLQHSTADEWKSLNNTVLLGIGGRRGNKLWFNDYWLTVNRLLKESGYSVAMVGSRDHNGSGQIEELEKAGIHFFETKSLAECIDIISNSQGMITIDSGLMHISAMQGIPTVGMFGPMPAWLWGPKAKNVVNLETGMCKVNCSKMPLDWECVGRPCMRTLKPMYVLDQFYTLLGEQIRG